MEVVATRDFVQIGSLLKFPIQFFRTPPMHLQVLNWNLFSFDDPRSGSYLSHI